MDWELLGNPTISVTPLCRDLYLRAPQAYGIDDSGVG